MIKLLYCEMISFFFFFSETPNTTPNHDTPSFVLNSSFNLIWRVLFSHHSLNISQTIRNKYIKFRFVTPQILLSTSTILLRNSFAILQILNCSMKVNITNSLNFFCYQQTCLKGILSIINLITLVLDLVSDTEDSKQVKYALLSDWFIVTSVAVESSEVIDPNTTHLLLRVSREAFSLKEFVSSPKRKIKTRVKNKITKVSLWHTNHCRLFNAKSG